MAFTVRSLRITKKSYYYYIKRYPIEVSKFFSVHILASGAFTVPKPRIKVANSCLQTCNAPIRHQYTFQAHNNKGYMGDTWFLFAITFLYEGKW